ncbi:MAG: dTMP kinase [Clostridia bacterium]|nr:dTMP kinase [Clostridia bacterium]
MNYDAIIFDLDGTITESAPGIMKSAAYALEKMNKPVPGEDVLRKFVGPPLHKSFMDFCSLSDDEATEAVSKYRERHTVVGWKEANVYTGILPMLLSLKKNGAYIALASSKPQPLCVKTLEYFGILPLFDKVVGPDYQNKSGEKEFLIRNALPEKYQNACMVGDRKFDIEGAKKAGVTAVGVGYGYGSREELTLSGCDAYCETVEDLSSLLLENAPRAKGLFITFEGSDGCGKSTQLNLLKDYLISSGARLTVTREPGGCEISERIRSLVLDVKAMGMTDACEALLFAAARSQHVNDVIKPALEKGNIVLCDRYVDSSIAYQGGGRGLGDWVRVINEKAVDGCMPDLTLLFDLNAEEALRRRTSATGADRIESAESGFMTDVYNAFMALATEEPDRIKIIDANGKIEQIESRVRQMVTEKILTLSIAPEKTEG